jgi:hypothetical protein
MSGFRAKKGLLKLATATTLTIVTFQATDAAQATTLTGFQTSGNQMAGTKVTANFLDGGSETKIWAATGGNSGGVTSSNWSLNQSGDTFSLPWTLNSTRSIASVIINAIPGNTVFDTTFGDAVGTPGSALGKSFTVQSGLAPTSSKYSVPIDISVGDLFGTLTLDWKDGFLGKLTYLADTDSGTTDDPVKPDPDNSVPEPLTILGTVTAGVFGAALRRKQQQKQKAMAKA